MPPSEITHRIASGERQKVIKCGFWQAAKTQQQQCNAIIARMGSFCWLLQSRIPNMKARGEKNDDIYYVLKVINESVFIETNVVL